MQATITYLLSEQAQRAQMAATGQPVARKQTTTEDVPTEYLTSPYCVIGANGEVIFDLTKTIGISDRGDIGSYNYSGIHGMLSVQPESGLAALAAKTKEVAAKSAELKSNYELAQRGEQERAKQLEWERNLKAAKLHPIIQAYLGDPSQRAEIDWTSALIIAGQRITADSLPQADWRALDAETQRRKKLDEAAKEQAKMQFLNEWVADSEEYFTDSATLKQQWADGLLCRAELLKIIADQTFADLALEEHDPNICKNRNCECSITDIKCLPLRSYPAWRAVKERLPEGTVAEFEQVRECLRDEDGYCEDGQDASEPYITALIKLPVGPFVFERRIKL